MADKKNMSVEDILAACRNADGGEGSSAAPPASSSQSQASSEPSAESSSPSPSSAKPKPGAAKPKPAAAKPGAMSTADILAAARSEKQGAQKQGGGGTPAESSEAAAASSSGSEAGETKPAAAKPKPGQMSVADILAAARSEKAAGAKAGTGAAPAKPAAKAAPKPQPAAREGAATATAEKPKPSGPKDTASILAAARKSDKPGPVPRSEAAGRPETAAEPPKGPAKQRPQVPPMPQRPEYLRGRQPAGATAERSERRSFLGAFLGVLVASPLAVGFSSLAVTHLLWVLGLARYMFPNILTEPPTRFKVGFPDEYAPGMVETRFKAQFGVWVVRAEYEGEMQIFALQSICTHLGCTPNWLEGEQKFKCPCHGSGFYKDGINFEGPAPRPLERYAIQIADDGQLEVDKSQTFQQELGQWADSSSFVPV